MASRSLTVRASLWLAIAACAQACAQAPQETSAASGGCNARILIGFRAPADAAVVAALASSHALTLSVVNRLLPDLYVLDLGARGGGPACADAIERLRADTRVRSVELDSRRAPHAG
jgi:hypothetical protein